MNNGRTTHGMTGTRFYRIWCGMKRRCYNKNEINYCRYGGSGVIVCDKWHIFTNFMEDMHDSYSKGLSIDRIDSTKGYSLNNCRWVTIKQQANNKINVLNYKGKNFSDWDKDLGFKHGTIRSRVRVHGWSIERAVSTPKKREDLTGIHLDNRGLYRSEVWVGGKNKFLGRFKTESEAVEARKSFLFNNLPKECMHSK